MEALSIIGQRPTFCGIPLCSPYLLTKRLHCSCASTSLSFSPRNVPLPPKGSRVSDPCNLLTHNAVVDVDNQLRRLALLRGPSHRHCWLPWPFSWLFGGTQDGGEEVAVAVIPKINKLASKTYPRWQTSYCELIIPGIFARSLHNFWGVGCKRCNNGILLFLSTEDRAICCI